LARTFFKNGFSPHQYSGGETTEEDRWAKSVGEGAGETEEIGVEIVL
jgi:hypothetical protein